MNLKKSATRLSFVEAVVASFPGTSAKVSPRLCSQEAQESEQKEIP